MTASGSSIGRIAVRSTVWLTIFAYAGQLVAFVATIVLTRELGPQVFGLLALGTFWSSLLNLRTKFGLGQAAIRQPALDGELLGTVYRLDLVLAGGSVTLSLLGALVLFWTGHAPEISIIVVVSVIASNAIAVVSPFGLALEKEIQLSRLTLLALFSAVMSYGTAILLAKAGWGFWSLLVVNVITALIAVIGVYILCKRRLPWVFDIQRRFTRPMAGRLIRQGIPAGLSSEAILTIVNQFDNYLIGTFVGTATLGFYDRAYRTAQWPNVLLTAALARVGFLTFARLQDDLPRLAHAMRLCIWVLTTLGTPMTLALFFGARELVELLYTAAWLPSAFFLRFLVVYSLISPFISLGSSLAYARGHIRTTVLITATQAISIVVIGPVLTLWQGATGTVVAVGITIAIGFTLSCRYIFRQLPLSFTGTFGPPLLSAVVASAVTLLVFRTPGWGSLPTLARLILSTLASAGVYLVCVIALRPTEMTERLRYLLKMFRPEPQPT